VNLIQRFDEYAQAFEEAFESDDWAVVAPHFAEDAVYEIFGEPPLGGRHEGRDAVLAHFKQSLDTFDRLFDSRALEMLEGPELRGDSVWFRWRVTYGVAGAPDIAVEGEESVRYAGDRIERLEDRFAEGTTGNIADYMSKYAANLRPVGGNS
jgi:hypothetical protein